MPAFVINPDPLEVARYKSRISMMDMMLSTISHLGGYADNLFQAFWNPVAPSTTQDIADWYGTQFLALVQEFIAIETLVLQMEAANGIDSSRHPWARRQADGTYQPGTPPGVMIIPVIVNGVPTGEGTIVAQQLTTVTIDPKTVSVDSLGLTQFTVSGKDQFGQPMEIEPSWSWETDAGAIGNGQLTCPEGPATVTVQVSANGVADQATVTVNAPA